MKTPKVSIIVPVYNVERYLDRCIQSLVNQSLKDIEIILVDDGSPDNCPKMCDEYAQKDNRIKVIHKQNAGLGYARNSGLDVAIGEYVAFVDSDDYVDTAMYETLYERSNITNADATFCGFKTEMTKDVWRESREVTKDELWECNSVKEFMYNMIASGKGVRQERLYQMSVWHAIYKREIIVKNDILFPSERDVVSEDIPFQVDFLKKANKILYLNKHFYYYCYNIDSLTFNFKPEKFDGFKILRKTLLDKDKTFEYINRVNRLFIGYVRSYYFSACLLDKNTRRNIFHRTVYDNSWSILKSEFKPSYLPLYSRIIYLIIISKKIILLDYVLHFFKRFRHAQNKC